jgi:hypothetical protein
MKKSIISLILIITNSLLAYSQTNTFPSSGNAGIGITNPTATLQIKSTAAAGTPVLRIDNTWANYSAEADLNRPFVICRNGGVNEAMFTYVQDGGTYIDYKNDEASSRFVYRLINTDTESGGGVNANTNEVLILHGNNSGGGVSIGTPGLPSDTKLAVNGTIKATEVKVETGWADFVFEDDYKLQSLSEVESFIKENKHLPDIPSEADVKENGLSLGEMDAKLLQKIEELTLHMIEMQKVIAKQQNEIEKLKNK